MPSIHGSRALGRPPRWAQEVVDMPHLDRCCPMHAAVLHTGKAIAPRASPWPVWPRPYARWGHRASRAYRAVRAYYSSLSAKRDTGGTEKKAERIFCHCHVGPTQIYWMGFLNLLEPISPLPFSFLNLLYEILKEIRKRI
jgi:hypothetical protein